jgi:hypothetical protein
MKGDFYELDFQAEALNPTLIAAIGTRFLIV